MAPIFDVLFLLARPGAGKSEIIDYLSNTPIDERIQQFHIGELITIDDFPMLWTWFEEDAILTKLGKPQLHTDAQGYFKYDYLWDVLIERICLEYDKQKRDIIEDSGQITFLIEFSRGTEHGGYQRAFEHLSKNILKNAAILYVDVSWEESLRKNRKRFNPERPDSILEHGLSDEKLIRLYKETDWNQVSANSLTHLNINGHLVPYAVFNNNDDVTTQRGQALGFRLEEVLNHLWGIYKA